MNQWVQRKRGGRFALAVQPTQGQNAVDQAVEAVALAVQPLPQWIIRAQVALAAQRQADP